MIRAALLACLALEPIISTNGFYANEIPYTATYASYRKRLLEFGWKPDLARGCKAEPYPEHCGNQVGSGFWIHPVSGMKIGITTWRCMHGWCVGPLMNK
jgi:hypothetical protein